MNYLAKLYAMLWNQCDPTMKEMLQSEPTYKTAEKKLDFLTLILGLIGKICLSTSETSKYTTLHSYVGD